MNRPPERPPIVHLFAHVVLGNAAMGDTPDALEAMAAALTQALDVDAPPESHAQPLRDANGNTVGEIRWKVSR